MPFTYEFGSDTVQRGVTTDPDALAPGPGDAVELQMVIASLRDVIRKQAEELQAAKTETAELKKQSTTNKSNDAGLQQKLTALESEREVEVRQKVSSLLTKTHLDCPAHGSPEGD